MAYHFPYQDLHEVTGIDELDSCAYTILAGMFSSIEEAMLERQRHLRFVTLQKKKKLVEPVQKLPTADERLKGVLGLFGLTGASVGRMKDRIEGNVKYREFWRLAQEGRPSFIEGCALMMAHCDMADLPGNQCIAVVRHERKLYVTGNGLWVSGDKLEENGEGTMSPDLPWFSSGERCQAALRTLAGSIQNEYMLEEVILVVPSVGDVKGKFHAEMQLLDFILDHDILPERGYIGVSKPCCSFCQLVLQGAGLYFWQGHGLRGADPNESVEKPYDSYKDPLKVERFKAAVSHLPFYGIHGS